jgi:hypothetical protein
MLNVSNLRPVARVGMNLFSRPPIWREREGGVIREKVKPRAGTMELIGDKRLKGGSSL